MAIKKTKICLLCGLQEEVNRKKVHHIMPRRYSKDNRLRIWLCRFCHMILHKAEYMALCKLPETEEEHRKWKQKMIIESAGFINSANGESNGN